MADRGLNRVMQHMRLLVETGDNESSDGQLIEQFVRQQNETAFAALVYRHGPMVRAVCRRELHDAHDSEDAFQATFMVLARKAHTLSQRERLASWLHGVAFRIARKGRVLQVRRRMAPLDSRDVPAPEQMCDLAWRELQLVLDEEVCRLPHKYRDPVVLCYFEGLTYTAAAQRLDVPAGTVSGRLDRAREMLRTRLVRRGLTLSAGLLSTLIANNASSAAVTPALLQTTVDVALAFGGLTTASIPGKALLLAEGTMRSLFFAKLRLIAGVLFISMVTLGAGVGLYRLVATEDTGGPALAQDTPPRQPVANVPVPERSEAQKLVDRALQAVGGKNKAASLRSASWTMVFDPGEATEIKQHISAVGHEQYRIEYERVKDGKPRVDVYVVNKDVGWRRDAEGNVADVPAVALAANKEHFYAQRLIDLLPALSAEKMTMTVVGQKTFGERTATGLRVERAGLPATILYFDSASGLVVRSEATITKANGTRSNVVFTFEDYRDSDGVKHHTRVVSQQDDEAEVVLHVRDFRLHETIDPQIFARP